MQKKTIIYFPFSEFIHSIKKKTKKTDITPPKIICIKKSLRLYFFNKYLQIKF